MEQNKSVKRLIDDSNLIPTPCGRGSSCASEASYKCRGGVHTRHLSRHLTPHPVATLLPSPARGEGACHSNSGTPQSLINSNHFTHFTHLTHFTHFKKAAFTLAEVLVTLGVIGIVAAMTIPTVLNKYQQKVAETRLLKFYSVMNNAIQLSEIDNGDKTTWDLESTECSANMYSEKCLTDNFEKFFKPYLKISGCEYSNRILIAYFPDGSAAAFTWADKDIIFYPIGANATNENHQIKDKDYFNFGFYPDGGDVNYPTYEYYKGKGMMPYIKAVDWDGTEENAPCLRKTQLNGWKFPDECNPWK